MILLIAAGTALAYWSTHRALDAFQSVDHTQRVRIELENFRVNVMNAENSQRGYLLTGGESSLDVFEPSIEAASDSLKSLRTLTQDRLSQQQRLDLLAPLFDQKVASLRSQI